MRLPCPTPGELRETPQLATFAALHACLEIARSTLLANMTDEHEPSACSACLADVVLLNVDALQRALDRLVEILKRNPDPDF